LRGRERENGKLQESGETRPGRDLILLKVSTLGDLLRKRAGVYLQYCKSDCNLRAIVLFVEKERSR